MFELNQLEQLIAIAECQTISAAAERLHLSQPALSRSIQKLEAALQVTLFDREKNKITLNENGKIAVEYARRVLEQANDMTEQLQALDRSRRTVSLGSCAPAPLWDLAPLVSRLYPQKALISEMKETGALLQGMKDGTYQLVILPCPAEESALCCTAFESEQLYFALPPEHPLANAKGLHFKDLDGQAILMFSEIGFWKKVQQKMMPKTHTLIQENRADFETLVKTSVLPSFASDLAVRQSGRQNERVLVPILDKEASVTYFLVWKKEESKRWRALLEKIGERTARLKQA